MKYKKGDIVRTFKRKPLQYGLVLDIWSKNYILAVWHNDINMLINFNIKNSYNYVEHVDNIKLVKYHKSPLYKSLTKDIK